MWAQELLLCSSEDCVFGVQLAWHFSNTALVPIAQLLADDFYTGRAVVVLVHVEVHWQLSRIGSGPLIMHCACGEEIVILQIAAFKKESSS